MRDRVTTYRLRNAFLLAASCIAMHAGATTFTVAPSGFTAWNISTDGAPAVANASLRLIKGQTYTFNVTASFTHPFYINTVQGTGTSNAYMGGGLSNNGLTTTSTITFTPPAGAPATLFYDCANHDAMTGVITLVPEDIFADNFGNG